MDHVCNTRPVVRSKIAHIVQGDDAALQAENISSNGFLHLGGRHVETNPHQVHPGAGDAHIGCATSCEPDNSQIKNTG